MAHDVIESRQSMGLATAEVGDQREDRCRVFSLAGQPPQHHACVLTQGTGKARAREELRRIPVILRCRASYDLLQSDGELIGVERPTLTDLLPRYGNPIP